MRKRGSRSRRAHQFFSLTFNISGQVCYFAPFRYIDGATIKDLIIDGTIMNSQTKYDYGRYTAGLVANATGDCEIRSSEACSRGGDWGDDYSE